MFFKPYQIPEEHQPCDDAPMQPGEVSLSWLGTAGFIVNYKNTTLLIDPFVSRPGILPVALGRLKPDKGEIQRYVPHGDFIVVGHSHYDHLLDVPTIARRDNATVIGSDSTAVALREVGITANRIVTAPPEGGTYQAGDFEVTLIASEHGKVFRNRALFPGAIKDLDLPAHSWNYKMGEVYGVLIKAGDVSIYHNGSAGLVDEAMAGASADVLLVGLAGLEKTPDCLKRLVGHLKPSIIVPTHYDAFFSPLDKGLRLLHVVDFPAFFAEVDNVAPEAQIVMPGFFEPVILSAEQPARLGRPAT